MKTFYSILLMTSSLYGMEKPRPLRYERNMPKKDKCYYSLAFCKDKLFVTGSHGIEVYNNSTQALTKLSDESTFMLAKHPTSAHLAVSQEKELAIYNTETEEKIWTGQPLEHWRLTAISFKQQQDDLTLYAHYKGKLTLHNSKKSCKNFTIPFEDKNKWLWSHIAWHPTKEELLYPSKAKTVSILDPHALFTVKENIFFKNNNVIISAQYSPDGSHIVIKDNFKKCCLYTFNDKSFNCFTTSSYLATAFHPHQNMIALLNKTGAVEYWNYKTKQLIAKTNEYHGNDTPIQKLFSRTKRMDFSHDGKYLGIALTRIFLLLSAPMNNVTTLYLTLLQSFPADVVKTIFAISANLLDMHYFNFLELSKT